MSSRDSFWFLAGALVSIAILVTTRAWLRERPPQGARAAIPSYAVPIAAALALIGIALGIYFLLGSPDSIASNHPAIQERGSAARVATASASDPMGQSPANAGSLNDVTRKLAARLAANGGSDDEWRLLAQSYEYMGRTADAKTAQSHIASALPTDAGKGAAEVEPVSGEQLAAVADALDAVKTSAAPSSSNNTAATPKATSASSVTASDARISGTVEVVTRLAPHALAGATLFIYAKQPNAPGPPLAVLRVRADHWPVTFTLNDDNAMIPGRNLSSAGNVQIEARISRTGDALPRSGDLVGSVASVNPRDGHAVRISIDREIG